jgi:vancomycin permeability regulator SanA
MKMRVGRGNMSVKKSLIGRLVRIVVTLVLLCVLIIGATNLYVIFSVKDRIISEEQAALLGGADGPQCIEVLGAAVVNGEPSPMLAGRIDTGLSLYKNGVSDILLFSGDNGSYEYNEVVAMERYALERSDSYGLTAGCIYLDYAGFSTYESMYRLRDVFQVRRAVIVTQEYHLYRALYSANKLGVEAYGVAAPPGKHGQLSRDLRELLARTKDFFFVMFDVQPTFLGEPVELVTPN